MENFFSIGAEIDEVEAKEFLLHRYNSWKDFFDMETCEFLEFYRCAKKEEKREQHYSQWTALLPFMSMKLLKYMAFEEYEDKITGRNIDMRPDDEIIREIEELHRKEE